MPLYSGDSKSITDADNKPIQGLDNYPPVAFYFKVAFLGLKPKDSDTSFQDVSGIGSEMKTEDYAEGGENRFVHRLPKSVEYKKLVLKRGMATKNSELVKWCSTVLEGGFSKPIKPMSVQVSLMNGAGKIIRSWQFNNAYPVKWEADGFNSTKNDVAIETIELSYNNFSRET